MKYQIWHMKPEFFSDGITSTKLPQASNLTATHVHLKDIEADSLGNTYSAMQAEIWSPKGEARKLIRSKRLQHTSMSVGDVIVDDVGNAHVVAATGYQGNRRDQMKPRLSKTQRLKIRIRSLRPGFRKAVVFAAWQWKGPLAAIRLGVYLGLKERTAPGWVSTWENTK